MKFSAKHISILLFGAALILSGCEKENRTLQGKGDNGGSEEPSGEISATPAEAPYKVVAHRGGSSECGAPDNSRASLKYAQALKCYGSECDIYWTKDNNVIIAHATDTYYINGLKPWEHTVEEIQKAGSLKNGEIVPTLDDFLDIACVEGKCTKLILDIKYIDGNTTQYASNAVNRACEIIKSRGAQKWCEFICTGNTTVARAAAADMVAYGIPVGWMSNSAPSTHKGAGFTWANLSTTYITPYGTGSRTIDEFVNAGMEFSVFNVDSKKGDGNAVYSTEAVNYYVGNYSKLKFICTNYPSWLINQIKSNK